jgi:hypothetical protein
MHPDDSRQVDRREPVAPAKHGERNFPRSGLAFQPALLDPQDLGGFLCRVKNWSVLTELRDGHPASP